MAPLGAYIVCCSLYKTSMSNSLCVIWCKQHDTTYWHKMPYAPRSYEACEPIIEAYEDEWGSFYTYEITPNNDFYKPRG